MDPRGSTAGASTCPVYVVSSGGQDGDFISAEDHYGQWRKDL
jgi:hypothetical protein